MTDEAPDSELARAPLPMPPVLSDPSRRLTAIWDVANRCAQEAAREWSIAMQQGYGGAGTGVSAREIATSMDKPAILARKEARASFAAGAAAWDLSMKTTRFALELEKLIPPAQDAQPLDPATQALVERQEREAREKAEASQRAAVSLSESVSG